jgi:hypothetical protein
MEKLLVMRVEFVTRGVCGGRLAQMMRGRP